MAELLIFSAAAIMAVTALGLAWTMVRGGILQHMMAVQLLGTGGAAALLILAAASDTPAMIDLALTLVILAAFSSAAFALSGRSAVKPGPGPAGDA